MERSTTRAHRPRPQRKPFAQSLPAVHSWPAPHGGHSCPPQSRADSNPFRRPSLQIPSVGTRVGTGVGLSVGRLDGFGDGASLPRAVGRGLGAGVVAGVGAREPRLFAGVGAAEGAAVLPQQGR